MNKLLLRVEDVQKALGLGRSKIYQMMANGDLPVVRIGRSVRVPNDALQEWVGCLAASTSKSESNKS